jgi:hypothetical protein
LYSGWISGFIVLLYAPQSGAISIQGRRILAEACLRATPQGALYPSSSHPLTSELAISGSFNRD